MRLAELLMLTLLPLGGVTSIVHEATPNRAVRWSMVQALQQARLVNSSNRTDAKQ